MTSTQQSIAMLGNAALWTLPKTAFLCSDKYSAGSVLKSYDWAGEMRRDGRCVISGFQSRLERDVLDILLSGNQPIIIALARSMYVKPPERLKPYVDAGRLLFVSPFSSSVTRANRETAFARNHFIAENADEVVFGYIHPGGMLERLIAHIGTEPRVLDRLP